MKLSHALRACVSAAVVIALTACSPLTPKYERPEQQLPKSWRNVDIGSVPLNIDWWTRFEDPALTGLIEAALRQNMDLAQSLAKIDSAAAQAGVSSSALLPNVTASGQADASLSSEKGPNMTSYSSRGLSRDSTTYQGSIKASWELDIWGKNRANYMALTDILMQTILGHEAARLEIAGSTAKTYFALLALDMQLETAKRTLRTREESLKIYTDRYRQGDITELDWQRAKAEVETARAQVHTTAITLDSTEAALAVLVGRQPSEIVELPIRRGKKIDKLPNPPVIPEGLPSLLLERRPDIRAAEYGLKASNEDIGAARAQFFPTISLTGAFGTLAAAVANLFTGPAALWTYGVAATLPIFDGGRNWYNLKDAEAKKRQAIALYCKTVQSAFKDVRTSLTAQTETRAIVKAMESQVQSLRRSVEIARLQYANGYTDYLTVLDAERQLFAAELSLASALEKRLDAVVDVCMALGGGWKDPGETPGWPIINAQRIVDAQHPGLTTPKTTPIK